MKQTFSDESSIIVHELGQGVMIQAGDAPQIGDIGKKGFIPLYRKVAKVLRPVRVEKYGGGGFGYDESAEWLEGLDKDYE